MSPWPAFRRARKQERDVDRAAAEIEHRLEQVEQVNREAAARTRRAGAAFTTAEHNGTILPLTGGQ